MFLRAVAVTGFFRTPGGWVEEMHIRSANLDTAPALWREIEVAGIDS